jgi:hypothetical protein
MMKWRGWYTVLVLAGMTCPLLLGDLSDRDWAAAANALVFLSFGAAGLAIYRVLHGDRAWQRRVQAWAGRPMTHWNDWRIIGLLAAIALGLYLLGIVDLPPGDKWSSAGVLLLFALCLVVQMLNVGILRRRDRK